MDDTEQATPGDPGERPDDPTFDDIDATRATSDEPGSAVSPGGDGGSSDDDTQPDDAGQTGTLGDHDVS